MPLSDRAQIVERRTYLRPVSPDNSRFETPDEAIDRQIQHQRWLWRRAKAGMVRLGEYEMLSVGGELGTPERLRPWRLADLTEAEEAELEELRGFLTRREACLAGRTRWLGGTEVSREREASQFNCSFLEVRTIHDVVDIFWLLLQGCGVGFRPVVGSLNGFGHRISEIEVVPSTKEQGEKGRKTNKEIWDPETRVWTIQIGDSAEAWAKSIGKLVAGKYKADKLVLDFSEIRGPGGRLSGYGWVCSGYKHLARAMVSICGILNRRAGQLVTRIDILDIVNHLGTTLSSRRSSQIALMDFGEPEWEAFADAKKDYYLYEDRWQRSQSNNTVMFRQKPTRYQLRNLFRRMSENGGSEPGVYNALAAQLRAAYFKGTNPCAEILLGDKSFCNLVEIDVGKFNGREEDLWRCVYVMARANYRQTCVNLDDGILQRAWHEMNEFLRLCGVGVTGIVRWEHHQEADAWKHLRVKAHLGANGMADELGMPRPQNVTAIKPSGTASKTMSMVGDEVTEGVHKPLGRFIFNWVIIPKADDLTDKLKASGYRHIEHPNDDTSEIFCLPVEYSNIDFTQISKDGRIIEINDDSAVEQLNRYRLVMDNYVDHNCSITVSYSPEEVGEMVDWMADNWDAYVGVAFLYRTDPSKTAADLGHPYLPQEVVDEATFRSYTATLKPLNIASIEGDEMLELGECAGGACPVR